MNPWQPWFAWYPVGINVYRVDEIRNGELHYKVWLRWVERRLGPDGEPPLDFPYYQYRLLERTS